MAVAARDPERAARFAAAHGVERVLSGYEDLIADPEVEVVYNALPNSFHGPWNLAAIAAGKHVLTEKPFASNTDEARTVADAAKAADVIVFDGFHYRYHPIFNRLLQLITNGEIGALRSVKVQMLMPAPSENDLRWSLPLAGGVMMDLGCYALHVITTIAALLGGSPELVRAEARQRHGRPGVDERFGVEMRLPGGVLAQSYCDMNNPGWDLSITATGDTGEAKILNFIKVSSDDRLIIRRADGTERIEHLGTRSSYHYQLDALTAAVRHGTPVLTDAADGVVNLQLIDDCYRKAGLAPRPTAGTVAITSTDTDTDTRGLQ